MIDLDYRKLSENFKEDKLDKQFTYYTLRLLEALVYPYKQRRSFLNRSITHRSLLEDLPTSDLFPALNSGAFVFWEVFYRHNNYFLEKNASLLPRLKKNRNFEQASIMNDNSIGFENFIEFFDRGTNSLSPIGVRVCSLIDIIRSMRSMAIGLSIINAVVKDLAERFKVDIEIIERVFRASEDSLSLLTGLDLESKGALKVDRMDVFKQVLDYLDCKDGGELAMIDKHHYKSLKDAWILSNLVRLDNLNEKHELRVSMWTALLPQVDFVYPGDQTEEVQAAAYGNRRGLPTE